jgi:hypothetical protein
MTTPAYTMNLIVCRDHLCMAICVNERAVFERLGASSGRNVSSTCHSLSRIAEERS